MVSASGVPASRSASGVPLIGANSTGIDTSSVASDDPRRLGSSAFSVKSSVGLLSKSSTTPAFRWTSGPESPSTISNRSASAPVRNRLLVPTPSSKRKMLPTLIPAEVSAASEIWSSPPRLPNSGGSLAPSTMMWMVSNPALPDSSVKSIRTKYSKYCSKSIGAVVTSWPPTIANEFTSSGKI